MIMKKNLCFSFLGLMSVLSLSCALEAGMKKAGPLPVAQEESSPANVQKEDFFFDHGPYLQERTATGVTLVFTTTKAGVPWVEVLFKRDQDKEAPASLRRVYGVKDGLRAANVKFNTVRLEGLDPKEEYVYRIGSKEFKKFVVYGQEIYSPWYTLENLPQEGESSVFIAMSDLHDDSAKMKRLLEHGDYKNSDAVFLVGDAMSHCYKEYQAFESYLDTCVEMFAKSKPLLAVRGNHETRGHLAREYAAYTPRKSGKIYGTQQLGDVFIVFLDSGEDKEDDHKAYSGLADFDGYRSEQAEWLKNVVASPEYKKAAFRVVLTHFPLNETSEMKEQGYGVTDLSRKVLPVLRGTGVDLAIAGHTHVFLNQDVPAKEELKKEGEPTLRDFAMITGSNKSGVRVEEREKKLFVRAYDLDNKTLVEKVIPARQTK